MNAPIETNLLPRMINMGSIYPSPNMTRITRSPEADERLAADIKQRGGLLQAITVRPRAHPTEGELVYEVVFGHRRFQGAKTAGLEQVQAYVRELTDEEALELQIVENHQREKPDELGEALGFKQLKDEHGWNADKIAEKIKMSREQVYARLKLLELSATPKQALIDGKISASVALLIARVPEALQQKALDQIISQTPAGDVLSYRRANDHLKFRFTIGLKGAVFDITDTNLCAAAGSCTDCPKRSGNDIFMAQDLGSADICTDTKCHEEKKAAHYQKVRKEIEAKGGVIISGEDAKPLLGYGGCLAWNSALQDIDDECEEDKDGRTYRQILDQAGVTVETVAIENPKSDIHGKPLIVAINEDVLAAALEKAGWNPEEDNAPITNNETTKAKAAREKQEAASAERRKEHEEKLRKAKIEGHYRASLFQAIRIKAGEEFAASTVFAPATLTAIAVNMFYLFDRNENTHALMKMWGYEPTYRNDNEQFCKVIIGLDTPALCLFMVDLGLILDTEVNSYDLDEPPARLLDEAKRLGIDADQIRAETEKENTPKEEKATPAKKKPTSTPRPAAPAKTLTKAANAKKTVPLKSDEERATEAQAEFSAMAKEATTPKAKKPAPAKPATKKATPAAEPKAKAPAKPKKPAQAKPAKEEKTESTPGIKSSLNPTAAWPFPTAAK